MYGKWKFLSRKMKMYIFMSPKIQKFSDIFFLTVLPRVQYRYPYGEHKCVSFYATLIVTFDEQV